MEKFFTIPRYSTVSHLSKLKSRFPLFPYLKPVSCTRCDLPLATSPRTQERGKQLNSKFPIKFMSQLLNQFLFNASLYTASSAMALTENSAVTAAARATPSIILFIIPVFILYSPFLFQVLLSVLVCCYLHSTKGSVTKALLKYSFKKEGPRTLSPRSFLLKQEYAFHRPFYRTRH